MSRGAGGEHDGAAQRPRHTWTYEREKGPAFDRVAYFTDAVFAIAMTLLIVAVGAPELRGAPESPASLLHPLKDMWPELFSFFLAFLLLGRYWMAHHAFFAVLRRVDRRFIWLNLTYLAFVAFLPFPTEIVGSYEQNPISVMLFAITLAAISGLETVLFRHAHRSRLLGRPMSETTYRYGMVQSTTPVVLFLLSIPIAWFWNPTVAWLTWLLTVPIDIWVERRQRARAQEQGDTTAPFAADE